MDKYTIFYFIFQFFLLVVAAKLVDVFYEKRRTTFKIMLLSLLLLYFLFCLLYLILSFVAPAWLEADVFFIFLQSFVITLNYKSTVARRFAAAFSTGIILIFSIIVIGGMIVPLVLPDLQVGSREWSAVSNGLLVPLGLLIAKILQHFKSLKKKAVFSRLSLISPLIGLIIILLLFSIPIASSFGIDITKAASTAIVIIFIAWFLYSSLFLYDILSAKYEEKLKLDREAQEKEYYYNQCLLMQESVEQVRTVRHDLVSHLAAIRNFTDNGDVELIKKYLDRLVSDIKKSEVYSNTGNVAFDSIINYKLRNAKQEDIELDINIAVPQQLSIDVVDIIVIMGNIIDNALEAVAKVREKSIRLEVRFSKGCLWVKIENSFSGEIKYDRNSLGKEILSLKSGNEHGYGLKNINKSVEKYNGYMKVSHTEDIFSTNVFLYVSDS